MARPVVLRKWCVDGDEDDTFLAVRGLWSWSVGVAQAISIRRVVLCKVLRQRQDSSFDGDAVFRWAFAEDEEVVLLAFGPVSTSLAMGFPYCMSHSDRLFAQVQVRDAQCLLLH